MVNFWTKTVKYLLICVLTLGLLACAEVEQKNEPVKPTAQPTLAIPKEEGYEVQQYNNPPPMSVDPSATYSATMSTSLGTIVIELLVQEAPNTVNNFVFLANEGFYNDVVFHRVIKGFMVQGGDPTGTGAGGPGYRFADEPVTRDYVRGTVAMANAGPNTNGSQFFIMHQRVDLPKNYTIFGQVSEGLETLDKIADVEVAGSLGGERSKPVIAPTIGTIVVEKTDG